MAAGANPVVRAPSARVIEAGLDHVRLSYLYLDQGDIDGYGSLLDADAVLYRPGGEPIRGRSQIERFQIGRGGRCRTEHLIHEVLASQERVVVTGRIVTRTSADGHSDVDFADIFTLSDSGLLLSQRTYYFVEPV
ncbi:MAG TPA: nuclear transport factor 2 family protein [Micromonospora sp.]